MAPSVSKEELMRNTDSVIWGFSGGTNTPELSNTQRVCETAWKFLNSRLCNVVIIVLVFTEAIIILSELLIDLDLIQDPKYKTDLLNCSQNDSLTLSDVQSPRVRNTKEVLSLLSLSILIIFIVEILARIISGKSRYIVQGIEVFDSIVVLIAFGLDVAFFVAPTKAGVGKESTVLIILLRLWRIHAIFKATISLARKKLVVRINDLEREKLHLEHKLDLHILKTEDLEHECAFHKEKLKKYEREPLFVKRRKAKESASLPFPLPSSVPAPAQQRLRMTTSRSMDSECHSPYPIRELKNKVTLFAENAAAIILDEALLLASHIQSPSDLPPHRIPNSPPKSNKSSCKLKRRPDGSIESGYGSVTGSMNWSKTRPPSTQEDDKKSPTPLNAIKDTLKCPESSPESGYGSGGSAHNPGASPNGPPPVEPHRPVEVPRLPKLVGTVFLFPESRGSESINMEDVRMKILDEKSEIERIKHVEFNPYKVEKNVPMTSL